MRLASSAMIMMSSLVSNVGFMPPFHTCRNGLLHDPVISGCPNSHQALAAKAMSDDSMVAVISMSLEMIISMPGSVFLIIS